MMSIEDWRRLYPNSEERFLMERLENHVTIYVGRSAGKEAAIRLREAGQVTIQEGCGKDAGMWLVQRSVRARDQFRFGDGGGAA